MITLSDLPPEGDFEAIFNFAMSFNGYNELGSLDASARAANLQSRTTLEEVRNELFFEARRSRWNGTDTLTQRFEELLPYFRKFLA